jgi:hypothetical protein
MIFYATDQALSWWFTHSFSPSAPSQSSSWKSLLANICNVGQWKCGKCAPYSKVLLLHFDKWDGSLFICAESSGVGIGNVVIAFMCISYFCVIVSWAVFYMISSFNSTFPCELEIHKIILE